MVAGVSQRSSRVMQSPWIAPRWGRICGWEHLGGFRTGNALMSLQALTTQQAAEILQRDSKLSNLGGIATVYSHLVSSPALSWGSFCRPFGFCVVS